LWLTALLLIVAACSKKDTQTLTPDPPPKPTDTVVVSKIKVALGAKLIGPGEMVRMNYKGLSLITITDGVPGESVKYSIKAADTSIAGTRQLDVNGLSYIYASDVNFFNGAGDGEMTIKLDFKDTSVTLTATIEAFTVRDHEDLLALNYTQGIKEGETYVQVADIAFPDTVFTQCPVTNVIYGTYDGQGHKITNLNMSLNAALGQYETGDLALFKYVYGGGVVKNVQLELGTSGITVGAGFPSSAAVAGLVAYLSSSTIQNCGVKGDITVADGKSATGGGLAYQATKSKIIGSSYTGKVTNCLFGGLSYQLTGQVDMSYARYDYTGVRTNGIAMSYLTGQNDATWYISNSYTYINVNGSAAVLPFCKPEAEFSHYNCFSNYASDASGTTQYTNVADMNAALADLVVVNWPEGVPVATGKKPFVANGDALMKLWWQ
jgi:hypothetical protein